jgi:hypothetical protein
VVRVVRLITYAWKGVHHGIVLAFNESFWLPKRSEIASGTPPEGMLFFGTGFGRFSVDFGELFWT